MISGYKWHLISQKVFLFGQKFYCLKASTHDSSIRQPVKYSKGPIEYALKLYFLKTYKLRNPMKVKGEGVTSSIEEFFKD